MNIHRNGILILFLTLIVLGFTARPSLATEEFAIQTGQDCEHCHVNPSGGSELTDTGQGFALSLLEEPAKDSASSPQQKKITISYLVRLIAGYFHILFGFFWFGTILYVHLILKPAYASGGLPRGEVKLGLLSMLIMTITGIILFAYRIPSFDFLITTRFGILLLIKIALFLIMVCSALFVVLYIGPRLREKKKIPNVSENGDLTLEQLAAFDGKEDRLAYIAYQGTIYDVTNSHLWQKGSHVRRHSAGNDLTDALGQAPHGENQVLKMPRVGKLIIETTSELTTQQKVFFFMAYMNLAFVLLIVLILALWNWL